MFTKSTPYNEEDAQRMSEKVRSEGGCPICFKPYDPAAPSCNDPACAERWLEATPEPE